MIDDLDTDHRWPIDALPSKLVQVEWTPALADGPDVGTCALHQSMHQGRLGSAG